MMNAAIGEVLQITGAFTMQSKYGVLFCFSRSRTYHLTYDESLDGCYLNEDAHSSRGHANIYVKLKMQTRTVMFVMDDPLPRFCRANWTPSLT